MFRYCSFIIVVSLFLNSFLFAETNDKVSSQETNKTETLELSKTKDSNYDFGFGFDLGFLPGLKIRYLADLNNFALGADLDLTCWYALRSADFSLSIVFGYNFKPGSHICRPYITAGGGYYAGWDDWDDAGFGFHAGGGFEWKPASWFGLGIEVGRNIYNERGLRWDGFPYFRLTSIFYFTLKN